MANNKLCKETNQDVSGRISRLYLNYGLGNFTEITNTPFDGVWVGSVAFSDVNSGGREDLLIIEQKGVPGFENISKLYTNDGVASFTKEHDHRLRRWFFKD